MNGIRLVGIALLVAYACLSPKNAEATDCRHVCCTPQVVVETPVVVQAVPFFVPIATYTVSYQPQVIIQQQYATQQQFAVPQQQYPQGYQGTPTSPQGTFVPQGQPQVPPTPQNVPQGQQGAQASPRNVDYAAVFQSKCMKCHTKDIDSNGTQIKAFMSADGKILPIDSLLALRIAGSVYAKRMPKGGVCSDEEYGAIMSWLDSATRASVAQVQK